MLLKIDLSKAFFLCSTTAASVCDSNSPRARSHDPRRHTGAFHGGDIDVAANWHTQRGTGKLVRAARYLRDGGECWRLLNPKE